MKDANEKGKGETCKELNKIMIVALIWTHSSERENGAHEKGQNRSVMGTIGIIMYTRIVRTLLWSKNSIGKQ